MKAKSLKELITNIYNDISEENNKLCIGAIPLSNKFYHVLAEKYELNIAKIPELMNILKNSKMIFDFTVVNEALHENVNQIKGFIIVKGDLIIKMRKIYSDELIRIYTNEFNRKYSAEKIINEILPRIDKFNNTELGNIVNILANLQQYQNNFEKNILNYAKHEQEKNLEVELKNCKPLLYFFGPSRKTHHTEEPEKTTKLKEKPGQPQPVKKQTLNRRATDEHSGHDFQNIHNVHSLKKTVEIYGVDFYSRICFREYKFNILKMIVDENLISDKDDLLILKNRLNKVRTNSDNDANIQNYATEINLLMKSINLKLKQ